MRKQSNVLFLLGGLIVGVVLVAPAPTSAQKKSAAGVEATVYIVSPANGAVVSSPV